MSVDTARALRDAEGRNATRLLGNVEPIDLPVGCNAGTMREVPPMVLEVLKRDVRAQLDVLKASGVSCRERNRLSKSLLRLAVERWHEGRKRDAYKLRAKKAGETRSIKAANRPRAKSEHGTEAPLEAFASARHKPCPKKAKGLIGLAVKASEKSQAPQVVVRKAKKD
jgi:hypothetical protein